MKYRKSVDMADNDMLILKHILSFPKHYKEYIYVTYSLCSYKPFVPTE